MRALQVLVVVMGILIVAGVAVVVTVIVKRATQEQEAKGPPPLPAFGEVDLTLPDGARVVWATVEAGRLVIHIQEAGDAARFEVVDLATGNRLGAVQVGSDAAR